MIDKTNEITPIETTEPEQQPYVPKKKTYAPRTLDKLQPITPIETTEPEQQPYVPKRIMYDARPLDKVIPEKKTYNAKYEREKDREPVRGIFKFYEVPGGQIRFPYKKHKGEEVQEYILDDGKVYTLPLGVAKHLNKNGWYPQYEHIPGDTSTFIAPAGLAYYGMQKNIRIQKKVRRFGFQSLEFIDVDDISEEGSNVVGVEFTK